MEVHVHLHSVFVWSNKSTQLTASPIEKSKVAISSTQFKHSWELRSIFLVSIYPAADSVYSVGHEWKIHPRIFTELKSPDWMGSQKLYIFYIMWMYVWLSSISIPKFNGKLAGVWFGCCCQEAEEVRFTKTITVVTPLNFNYPRMAHRKSVHLYICYYIAQILNSIMCYIQHKVIQQLQNWIKTL